MRGNIVYALRREDPFQQSWLFVPEVQLKFAPAESGNNEWYVLSIKFSDSQEYGAGWQSFDTWFALTHLIGPEVDIPVNWVEFALEHHLYERAEYEAELAKPLHTDTLPCSETELADKLSIFDERSRYDRDYESKIALEMFNFLVISEQV